MLPFPQFAPDVSDLNGSTTATATNVVPRADGWGPVPSVTQYSSALAATCRGFFYGRNADGSITVFAGTSTKLYKMSNTDFTWGDVSKAAGTYSAVPTGDQWQFAQFNNFIFAVQINTVVQVFNLTSSTEFADLGGSPPQARYIAVVNRFLVLSGLGSSTPYRVQWSGLNATTTWTSGTNSSDFQDLPDGGIVRGVSGGESGLITQDSSLRRMIYAPGSSYIFQIERISEEKGIFAPLSLCRAGDRVFFIGSDGFKMILPGGYPIPIGRERVDRTFFNDVDGGNLQLCMSAADPKAGRVYWPYKSISGQTGFFDKIMGYDWTLDRFFLINQVGEYLSSLTRPGITLESLDSIASGAISISGAANNGAGLIRLTVSSTSGWTTGDIKAISSVGGTTEANGNWTITVVDATHIDLQGSTFTNAYTSGGIVGGSLDALLISLDDFSTSPLAQLAIVDSSHKLGFFTGSNLEATLVSSEQGAEGRRIFVRGFRPQTDAATVYGAVSGRETQQATASYNTEALINSQGFVPQRLSTRYSRGKIRIPSGTTWTYAKGIEPEFVLDGQR